MLENRELSQMPESPRPVVVDYWDANLSYHRAKDDVKVQKEIMALTLAEISAQAPTVVNRMINFANANLDYREKHYVHPKTTDAKARSSRDGLPKRFRMPEEQGGEAEFVVTGKITVHGNTETQTVTVKKPTDTAFSLTATQEIVKSTNEISTLRLQKIDGMGAWDLVNHGKDKPWHVQGIGHQHNDIYPSDPLITFNWFLDTFKQEVVS